MILVVQPVAHFITAAPPSSSHVPINPSPARSALAEPSVDRVIWNGFPLVSWTFHTPSNWLAARVAKLVRAIANTAAKAAAATLAKVDFFCMGFLSSKYLAHDYQQ